MNRTIKSQNLDLVKKIIYYGAVVDAPAKNQLSPVMCGLETKNINI